MGILEGFKGTSRGDNTLSEARGALRALAGCLHCVLGPTALYFNTCSYGIGPLDICNHMAVSHRLLFAKSVLSRRPPVKASQKA